MSYHPGISDFEFQLARSKVRASPSAPAFIERDNKAIVEQASPAY